MRRWPTMAALAGALVLALVPVVATAAPPSAPDPGDAAVHPLLRELDGRSFEAVGIDSDVGGSDLYDGASLLLTFRDGGAVASTSCGENVYPALTVETGPDSTTTIDFGRPSGPGCRMGIDGVDIPVGRLLWTDDGSGHVRVAAPTSAWRWPTRRWWTCASGSASSGGWSAVPACSSPSSAGGRCGSGGSGARLPVSSTPPGRWW